MGAELLGYLLRVNGGMLHQLAPCICAGLMRKERVSVQAGVGPVC